MLLIWQAYVCSSYNVLSTFLRSFKRLKARTHNEPLRYVLLLLLKEKTEAQGK